MTLLRRLATGLPLALVLVSLVGKHRLAVAEIDPTLATRAGRVLALCLVGTALALVPWPLIARTPRRRALGLALVAAALGVVCFANVLSFRQFGDLISIAALRYAGLAGDVHGAIFALVQRADLWFFADAALLALVGLLMPDRLAHALPRLPARPAVALALAAAIASVGVGALSPRLAWGFVGSTALAGDFGLVGYQLFDSARYVGRLAARRPATDGELDEMAAELRARATGPSRLQGVAKGADLLVVQVESLQDFPIELELEGVPVMPRLRALAAESLRFTQLHAETGQSATADAELLTNCSLHPSEKGAVHVEQADRSFRCLPWLTSRAGYTTVAAHANRPDFWNRVEMFPKMGFSRFDAERQFTIDEPIGLGLSDRSFYRQLVGRLDEGPRPFHAFAVSLTSHGPFDFPELPADLPLGRFEGTRVGLYLRAIHYADAALGALVDDLRARGRLDGLVLVIYGDHTGISRHNSNLAGLLPIPPGDEAAWYSAEKRVPLLVRLPHGAHAARIEETMGLVDLAPTLAGLLGLDRAGTAFVGRDVLADGTGEVAFPDGTALDDVRWFRTQGGCVARSSGAADEGGCAGLQARAAAAVKLSRRLVERDAIVGVAARLTGGGTPQEAR